jgi:hypothetical protein
MTKALALRMISREDIHDCQGRDTPRNPGVSFESWRRMSQTVPFEGSHAQFSCLIGSTALASLYTWPPSTPARC